MNKKLMCIVSIILALLMVFSSVPFATAIGNSVSNSPLKVIVDTNKDKYGTVGIAKFNVTITNVSDEDVKNVSAEALFNELTPVGRRSDIVAETEILAPGKSISFDFKAVLNSSAVDVSFFSDFILKIVKLFSGTVSLKDNGFDNGRDCITESKDILFGSVAISQIVNVYYESANFVLEANKKEVQTNDYITEVCFYAYPPSGVSEVELFDGNGKSLGYMFDDGVFSVSGDDMQNDGVFSLRIEIESKKETTFTAYAVAKNAQGDIINSSNSCVVEIFVYEPITDSQISKMNEVDQSVLSLINSSDYDKLTEGEKVTNVEKLLKEFVEEDKIIKNSIVFDETSNVFGFKYECGIWGGVMVFDFEEDKNGVERIETDSSKTTQGIIETLNTQSVQNGAALGEALILFSFNGASDSAAFRQPFYNSTESDWDSTGLSTDVDWQVTVNDIKNLNKDYEVICISGHGSTYNNQPVICLTEKATKSNQKTYSADLKKNRIAKVNTSSGTVYWVFPSLIEDTYDSGDLEGSFVFSECCNFFGENGNYTNAFSNAFLNSGANAVVGFHNSVLAIYCRDFMKEWVDLLLDGNTARNAFDNACSKYGSDDGGNPAAIAQFRGNSSARLVETGLKNGNFELATYPSYWSYEGDVRVISGLGDLIPQKGNRMAVLTTGIGSKESSYLEGTEGSVLQQTFIVPEDANTVSFKYNVVSEEPMEYVGSKFDDKYLVQIISENGKVVDQVTYESVNTSTWISIDGINFDGGDYTTFHTGWKTMSVDISEFRNEAITLRFVVYDVGDSIYDTATLVDDVVLS